MQSDHWSNFRQVFILLCALVSPVVCWLVLICFSGCFVHVFVTFFCRLRNSIACLSTISFNNLTSYLNFGKRTIKQAPNNIFMVVAAFDISDFFFFVKHQFYYEAVFVAVSFLKLKRAYFRPKPAYKPQNECE